MSDRRISLSVELDTESDILERVGRTPQGYAVRPIAFKEAQEFVRAHHYAKGMHNGPSYLAGLFDGRHLIGVAVFSTPVSERVRASVFGPDRVNVVTELSRFVLIDDTAPNSESWFLARAFRQLREAKGIEAVVSFADEGRGHLGIIYQAVNAVYYGVGEARAVYLDRDGAMRHRRQGPRNVGPAEAAELGWTLLPTGKKHRYCIPLPRDRRHSRELAQRLILPNFQYPKSLGINSISKKNGKGAQ